MLSLASQHPSHRHALQLMGTVKFLGPTEFAAGDWLGIELDEQALVLMKSEALQLGLL
jgi:hypothetical protein